MAAIVESVRPRHAGIDTFRGIVLAGMVIANHLAPLPITPNWLKHAPVFKGITILDLGFPFFLFIIGLLLPLSYQRRVAQSGLGRTTLHFLKRYGLLSAFGLAGNAVLGQNPVTWWGVLNAIGLAGLISLPFVRLSPGLRLLSGILLMVAFEVVKRLGYQDWLLANDHAALGGILGGIAWAGVILVASFLSQYLEEFGRAFRASLVLGLSLVSLGLILSRFVPVTKWLVTISYLAIGTGLACIALVIILALDRYVRFRLKHFIILGANPLIVYMLAGVLSEISHRLLKPVTFWAAFVSAAVVYAVCFLVAGLLYRRRRFIKV